MSSVYCFKCGSEIKKNSDVYIYEGKIFDNKDCILDYLYDSFKINHSRLVPIED